MSNKTITQIAGFRASVAGRLNLNADADNQTILQAVDLRLAARLPDSVAAAKARAHRDEIEAQLLADLAWPEQKGELDLLDALDAAIYNSAWGADA